MSFFNSIESAVSQLKSSIGTELDSTERNLVQLINAVSTDVDTAFESVYAKIRHILSSLESEVEGKVQNVDNLLIETKNVIQSNMETAYNTFVNNTKDEIRRMKDVSNTTVARLETASTYIKNRSENDIKHALDTAKKAFEDAKSDFESDVNKIVDSAILATKNGVKAIVNDAKEGTTKLNQLRIDVESELKSKFNSIEQDLINMKTKFSKEMDEVVSFGRRETTRIEQKFSDMSSSVKSVTNTIAIASILFSIAAGLGIIYMKEMRAGKEFEKWKKERNVNRPWSE